MLAFCQDSSVGFKNRLIDFALDLRELSIGRERAGDVRCVAVVLSSHVKQAAQKYRPTQSYIIPDTNSVTHKPDTNSVIHIHVIRFKYTMISLL